VGKGREFYLISSVTVLGPEALMTSQERSERLVARPGSKWRPEEQ
jgi:hypothetical protein